MDQTQNFIEVIVELKLELFMLHDFYLVHEQTALWIPLRG